MPGSQCAGPSFFPNQTEAANARSRHENSTFSGDKLPRSNDCYTEYDGGMDVWRGVAVGTARA